MDQVSQSFWKSNKQIIDQSVSKKNQIKKGPFSRSEQKLVDQALKKVLQEEGIIYDIDEIRKLLSLARKELPKNFWKRVSKQVPLRSVESVYDHARRRLSSKNYKGKWTNDDILKLEELVQIYGRQWTKIGSNLNRLPGACYDKWRDALKSGDKRKKGKWTQEERCKLVQLVTRQSGHQNIQEPGVDKIIRWTVVAEKIGTRSYLQCRNEWARFFIPGSKVRLNMFDTYQLVDAIHSLEISDETEIKWGELLEGVPAHKTYNKWRSLCRKFLESGSDENNFQISFRDAIFILKERFLITWNNKTLYEEHEKVMKFL